MDSVKITFLGQCGFLISANNTSILIDAVLNDLLDKDGLTKRLYPYPFKASSIKVDYMLFSHEHRDHFAYETAKDAYSNNSNIKYIMPKGFTNRIDFIQEDNDNVYGLSGVDSVTFNNLKVDSFETFHPVKDKDHNLGYVITINNKKIVHLGDTYLNDELFETLKNIGEIDVLMAPTNGRDYFRETRGLVGNMDMEEATILASTLNVKCFIPTHYDMMRGNTADIRRAINAAKEINYNNLKVLKLLEEIEI